MPVPFIFFSATTQEPSIPLTILWQIPPASCCIYRLVLCKLLALAFVCLAGISKHLPIISLICPALFSHDCSVWAFFPGSSRFPTRPSLVKLPLEPFQIPLRDKVYLSSAWCCNAFVQAYHLCCKIHEMLQILFRVLILTFIFLVVRAPQQWGKADLLLH